MANYRKTIDKGIAYLKKNGVRSAVKRAWTKARLFREGDYEKWLEKRRLPKEEQRKLEMQYAPWRDKIQVVYWGQKTRITPNTEYLLFMEGKGSLEPEALPLFARAAADHPQAGLIYCDSDGFTSDGGHVACPCFKPDFDLYLLRGYNYIGGCYLVKCSLLPEQRVTEAEWTPYDSLLRICERTEQALHIPRVLYHAPAAGYKVLEDECAALEAHFRRLGLRAEILPGEAPGIRHICYPLPKERQRPLVSVLIPNKDNTELLDRCLKSLRKQNGYEKCEILILENNSMQEETFAYYWKVSADDAHVRVLFYSGAFDFARINQFGASYAKGTFLLFLNNDTEMIGSGCLTELLRYAALDDVGVVGARMYYPDGTLQHAGIIVGYGGIAGHAFEGMGREKFQSIPWVLTARGYSAVTAACMMVKRELFEQLQGFCGELKVAYNDVDFCLRAEKLGKKVIYNPYAELLHYESQTRGLEMTREKADRVNREAAFFKKRWQTVLDRGDRHYNPNLTLEKADFSRKP